MSHYKNGEALPPPDPNEPPMDFTRANSFSSSYTPIKTERRETVTDGNNSPPYNNPVIDLMARTRARRNPFDPQTMDEYIGQDNVKQLLSMWIQAAKIQDRQLPHILITGEFGLGKTTLAKLVAQEIAGKRIHPKDANKLDLFNMPRTGLEIIDEIHNTASAVQDSLNIIMDNASELTIIGCTTDSGRLNAAFRSRFRIVNLRPYTVPDLIQIITLDYQKRGNVDLSAAQVVQIALRSRMNARQATQNLAMIFDAMAVAGETTLTDATMMGAFELLQLDERGLRAIDRQYLEILNFDKPVGLNVIESRLGADARTIIEEIEPFLLRSGLIDRVAKGRIRLVPNKIDLG